MRVRHAAVRTQSYADRVVSSRRVHGVITEVWQFPITNVYSKLWQTVATYCNIHGTCGNMCAKRKTLFEVPQIPYILPDVAAGGLSTNLTYYNIICIQYSRVCIAMDSTPAVYSRTRRKQPQQQQHLESFIEGKLAR